MQTYTRNKNDVELWALDFSKAPNQYSAKGMATKMDEL